MKFTSTPKQISIGLIALAIAAISLAFVLIPMPNPGLDAQQIKNKWTLPHIYLFENAQQVYNQLRKRQAWGAKTTQQAKQKGRLLDKKKWRLTGIVQTGQQRFALLLDVKKNKVQRYIEGDKLGNAGQLVKIHADSIEIKLAGNIDTEYLHPRKNAK